jgi:hypothetical protein
MEELAIADFAERYAEYFPKVYFQPLVDALSAVTVDDLGKDALRERLSKIVIRNTDAFVRADGATFADGVLTFDHKAAANVDYPQERAQGLQKVLESAL